MTKTVRALLLAAAAMLLGAVDARALVGAVEAVDFAGSTAPDETVAGQVAGAVEDFGSMTGGSNGFGFSNVAFEASSDASTTSNADNADDADDAASLDAASLDADTILRLRMGFF